MHLASGDINAEYSNLPEGQDASVDATVGLMSEMAKGQWGARSAKVRALAINLINAAGVANKDYFGMLEAIHNYVRDNIRYIKDPVGQETLSYPEETLFNSMAGDCDDMTIAEMGLLGAVGLRSYPVVIGLVPNHYSHVYLHAEIPPGKHRYANTTIAADPIMREWALGRAAPDARVKAKKVYPHLAGLDSMEPLNGYASGPSYFSPADELEATQVNRVLKSRYVDTGSRGEIVTTKRLTEWGDELDDMFNRGATINPMQAAPAFDLYSRGPVTNRNEKLLTSYLHQHTPDKRISAPMSRRGPNIVSVVDRNAPPRKGNVAPTVGELLGLSDYLTDLSGAAVHAGQRHLVQGRTDPLHRIAAAAAYTKQRAKKASGRVVNFERNSGFLFGLGDLEADRQIAAAKEIEQLAHQVAAKAQRLAEICAGASPIRQNELRQAFGAMDHMDCHLGVIDAVAEAEPSDHPRVDAQEKIDTLTIVSRHPAFRQAALYKSQPAVAPRRARPIVGQLPQGGVVRDQNGDVLDSDDGSDDGLEGWFKKATQRVTATVKKVALAPVRAVQSVHRQVQAQVKKAAADVKKVVQNKNIRKLALGMATGGASLLTEKTIHQPLQKLMNRGKSGGGAAPAADPSVVTPTSTALPPEANPDDGSIVPQPGESDYDPSGSPSSMPGDSFGPEDMGPAQEAESWAADEATMASGGGNGQSFTDTRDVDESGIDPFADEGESSGDDANEGSFMANEGSGDEDQGSDEGEASEGAAPLQTAPRKRRMRRRPTEDLDTEDVYDADDLDNDEDGGEGEEESSVEEPSVEGLPAFAGTGLGTIALIGLGLYFFTRK